MPKRLTARDYSLVVRNPPRDAYDPDEWRDVFNKYAEKQVSVVTVALNNGVLLRALKERRHHFNNLRLHFPRGTALENPTEIKAALAMLQKEKESETRGILDWPKAFVLKMLNLSGFFLEAEDLVKQIESLEEKIQRLCKQTFDVVEVYVTFETEEGMRRALDSEIAFRDQTLRIKSPSEPEDVVWENLGESWLRRLASRVLIVVMTLAAVVVSLFVVKLCRDKISAAAAGVAVALVNSAAPQGILAMSELVEVPRDESSFEKTLFVRLTLFRWITTAVVVKIITPFLATLEDSSDSILPTANAIMWSELILVPAIRAADLFSNLGKHVIAPRAKNQDAMNFYFQGTAYHLGERYADMTKVLFFVAVYVVLFPAVTMFGAAILFVQFFVSRVCCQSLHVVPLSSVTSN